MSTSITPHAAAVAVSNLRAARCFQLSAFIVLIFDHIITISDEVERIWKRPWNFPTILFFINRYVTPLMRIVIVVAFNDEHWPFVSCEHFVKFEGGGTMVLVAVAEVVMILRVYALYCGNKIVLSVLLISLVGQMGLTAASLVNTQPEPLLPGLHACILVGRDSFFAAFWAASLGTDTLVFGYTLYKVFQYRRTSLKTPILAICARDGILYFSVIFAANLLNTMLYLLAPPGIKAIGASFSQLITATMISRLQLNLRSVGERDSVYIGKFRPPIVSPVPKEYLSTVATSTITATTTVHSKFVGNLGEDLESLSHSNHHSWDEEEDETMVGYPLNSRVARTGQDSSWYD